MSTHLQTELEALEHRAGRVSRETQAHYRAALAQHLHGTLVIEAGERRVVNLHRMTQQNAMRREGTRTIGNEENAAHVEVRSELSDPRSGRRVHNPLKD